MPDPDEPIRNDRGRSADEGDVQAEMFRLADEEWAHTRSARRWQFSWFIGGWWLERLMRRVVNRRSRTDPPPETGN